MIADAAYTKLLLTHKPAKPRNRRELAQLTALLESLAANEKRQSPAGVLKSRLPSLCSPIQLLDYPNRSMVQ